MDLPSWVSADEDKPAPMPLLRVQAFVNTLDVDQGTDLLRDHDAAIAWLADVGLVAPGTDVSDERLELALEVREAIRSLLRRNGGSGELDGEQLHTLRRLAEGYRPSVDVEPDGTVSLAAAGDGADLCDGLLGLLLTIRDAQADGTWSRLKLCANPECDWAFYDRSRNRQGSWCTMASCGNRIKNRHFRARRR
jgi:predicted RNA-binding Zn ribbon-like protein